MATYKFIHYRKETVLAGYHIDIEANSIGEALELLDTDEIGDFEDWNRELNDVEKINTVLYKDGVNDEDIERFTEFSFDDLSEEAKDTAIRKLWDLNITRDWWDFQHH